METHMVMKLTSVTIEDNEPVTKGVDMQDDKAVAKRAKEIANWIRKNHPELANKHKSN